MGADTLNDAKLLLQTLVTACNAAPIPDPFKAAVTAIPTLALNIVASAQVQRPTLVFGALLLNVSSPACETQQIRCSSFGSLHC